MLLSQLFIIKTLARINIYKLSDIFYISLLFSVTLLLAGTAIALLTVVVLLIRWSVEEFGYQGKSWDHTRHWKRIVDFFIIGVTVLVVAVPEGLPLAVTLALAYSVRVSVIATAIITITYH